MNDKTRVYNLDCNVGMKEFPDKYFDLAIVDPPYGIDKQLRGGRPFGAQYKLKGWDTPPGSDYFIELYRVSNNQIVWGGNYFGLGRTRGFIIWDAKTEFHKWLLTKGQAALLRLGLVHEDRMEVIELLNGKVKDNHYKQDVLKYIEETKTFILKDG